MFFTCFDIKQKFIILFALVGDEFALRDGGTLYCKEDHDVLEKTSPTSTIAPSSIENNNNNNITTLSNNNNNNHSSELGSMSGKESIFIILTQIKIL